jgi:hypothetical protein
LLGKGARFASKTRGNQETRQMINHMDETGGRVSKSCKCCRVIVVVRVVGVENVVGFSGFSAKRRLSDYRGRKVLEVQYQKVNFTTDWNLFP